VKIEFLGEPRNHGGRLVSGGSRGQEVHAASFLRTGRVVLDEALLKNPPELIRIFTHELFHFAWVRLGNPARRQWEELLKAELQARARGELGWSAESRKLRLRPADAPRRTPLWRQYISESFCDTAAWIFSPGVHEEFTLAVRHRNKRRAWFLELIRSGRLAI